MRVRPPKSRITLRILNFNSNSRIISTGKHHPLLKNRCIIRATSKIKHHHLIKIKDTIRIGSKIKLPRMVKVKDIIKMDNKDKGGKEGDKE